MAAVMEATRTAARDLVRDETPARLRLLASLTAGAAAALLLVTGLVMDTVQDQVRVIGHQAAPLAATSADLYFALSDLDAQATRILLAGDADALAGSRLDALGAYRERGRQVDADLRDVLTISAGSPEQRLVTDLLDGLAVYRQRIGQALAAQEQAARTTGPATPAGRLSDDALGYYTQATTVLHERLLLDAQRLRATSEERLTRAYEAKTSTESAGGFFAVLLGTALLILLVLSQVWLARRFRRTWNPALIAATAISLFLVVAVTAVLGAQGSRLTEARAGGLQPYLELSELRAVGSDAAADTSRYVVSGNLAYYRDDFTGKSTLLTVGDLDSLAGAEAVRRWAAYRDSHERILGLADDGRTAEAVTALTGIRRGDAAFDFAYFDAAVATVTDARRLEFDRGLRAAESSLTGAVTVPVVALVLVIVLVALGVRRRLAEYR
ncbi:hypothetical protein [Actinoplanes sp. DH11]|uniref:hypothetical protein n=1 Tax=Actinoplanes sp. DH11 TaxID=2857011 RepID=UPI001E3C4555|nr:hypothetical protein [Actinoplanes sp. DH11]